MNTPWVAIKHDRLPDTYEIADKLGYDRVTIAVGVPGKYVHQILAVKDMLAALEDAANTAEQAAIDTKYDMVRHFYIEKAKKFWGIVRKAKGEA